MTPTELRIGNYVRLKDSGEIVRVAALTKRKVFFHYGNDKARLYHRAFPEIEPVLIREVHNRLPGIPHLMWADRTGREDLYYYQGVVITDLHELQNINFAFMGQEIEIEI